MTRLEPRASARGEQEADGPRCSPAARRSPGHSPRGAPARTRTWDLRIRSPLLYPSELRAPVGRGGTPLDLDDVLRRRTLAALNDVELDPLAFGQRTIPIDLDGRVMHEAVPVTAFGRYEPEAFRIIEPLHRTGGTHPALPCPRSPAAVWCPLQSGRSGPATANYSKSPQMLPAHPARCQRRAPHRGEGSPVGSATLVAGMKDPGALLRRPPTMRSAPRCASPRPARKRQMCRSTGKVHSGPVRF